MENNAVYVNEVIENYLYAKDEMKFLDPVTVSSLFRSCIEPLNPELPRSAIIIRDKKTPSMLHSVKLKNIKLNFRFALDMVLGVGALFDTTKKMLLWLILDVVCKFWNELNVTIKPEDAYIIYTLYEKDYLDHGLTLEEIRNYMVTSEREDIKLYYSETEKLEAVLNELEKINTILLSDGRYHLQEVIIA